MSERHIILSENTRFGGETGAGLMVNRCAFTAKDMGEEFDSAFTYAIVYGWGPDEPGDADCWPEMAERFGWDEPLLAFLKDAHERFAALPQRTDR